MDKLYAVRVGRFSRQFAGRTMAVAGVLMVITLAVMLFSLTQGKVRISVAEVMQALFAASDSGIDFIVNQLRLARIVLAMLVGGALAVSGLMLQSLVRNPLASPDILGITSGASAAAVGFLSFFSTALSQHWMPLAAIGGAWLMALLITLLAWRQGASPIRLVLVGVGLSALTGAATTMMLVFSPLTTTLSAYVWLTGSVYGAQWQDVRSLAVWLAAILPFIVLLARHVNVHELDDDLALGVGLPVKAMRLALLSVSVALAGAAIAYAGAMAFVGLVAPHIAKRLVGRSFPGLALVAALVGANLVMLADLAGRTLFLPLDLPAGVFVSALGTPFFIYLLIRQCR
ncbi:iron ABC transporter permease [Brenneria goodwinii]|uniref:Iron ABC transporter permease n=1 Tax=Brenneria goodwinii TaxID=1109412 RepID=A0A0G4JYW0_9GAMM|nr:iron ABC transporter permease [Brenneria goodwinii]ATA23444.1 iron ABC transporter permease [Brenneria goodwinii]MCG8154878.1 iron ABC transporter permease [Brenneria goodwinii]MCG8159785.1 iron ABC transporter permease [Brenneria goodwinii]MCG8164116.1 iron ABC transporter permease [Brenneria goodwinii]MCG8168725.1 iron ABC transporter permease [Brenneria goodwinii]